MRQDVEGFCEVGREHISMKNLSLSRFLTLNATKVYIGN